MKTEFLPRLYRFAFKGACALLLVCVAALVARSIFFSGPYRASADSEISGGIVDIHCHAAGIGAGSDCFVSPAMLNSYKLGIYLKSFGVTRAEVEEHGDALVIQKIAEGIEASEHVSHAIVLAMDGAVDDAGELDLTRTEIYIPNDFVAAETAKYDQLWFGASVNPYRHDALERLEQVKAKGAKLVKWIPSIQFIDPSDEAIVPFYEKLIELELPLLSHAGQEKSFTSARDELADPVRLRLPLKLGVTVIVAHIASTGANEGQRDTDRLRPLFAEFPNLYSEISSLTQVNKLGYLREALTRSEFEGRLLYGSDFPLINTALVSPWFFPMNLTREQMNRISSIENPWDRDIALKKALGVPGDIFTRSSEVFAEQP